MTIDAEEALPSLDNALTLIFFIATLIALTVAVVPPLWMKDDRKWRRPYWFAVCSAALFVFVAALPDWKLGLGMAAFGLVAMTVSAYFYSPFIQVRGKTYALHVQDGLSNAERAMASEPNYDPAPDSYGGVTEAKKLWWLLLVIVTICEVNLAFYLIDRHSPSAAMASIAFLLIICIMLGYFDASWNYAVARGQRAPFTVLAIMTAGLFAVLYLSAFGAGRRWPLRRKQSMEYKAHPRHQKNQL